MKLIVFSPETFPTGADMGGGISPTAKVSFSKTGKIVFSKPACEHLALGKNDKVSLAQGDNDPSIWFVFLDPDGFELLEGKRGNLILDHPELVQAYMQAWDVDVSLSHKAALSIEPQTIRKVKHWQLHLEGGAEETPTE